MKICYITATSPFGSSESFITEEMLEVKRQGINLLIIPRNPRQDIFHKSANELVEYAIWLPLIDLKMIFCFFRALIFDLSLFKIAFKIIKSSRKPWILIKNIAVLPKAIFISKIIPKQNVEHIHAHWGSTTATIAYVVSRLAKIPWSCTFHRGDIKENNMLREKVKSAHFIRCISKHGKNELINLIGEENKKKIIVIYEGIKIPSTSREVSKRDLIFRIVTPANLYKVKGHEYLIEACSILLKRDITNIRFVFYGEGALRDELKELIKKKSLATYIHMPGIIAHENLIEMYGNREIDSVVLPSITTKSGEHEGIPVSLMEAMANKIPTISTDTGGISELLSDGAGIVVEEKNSEKLANAIEILLKNQRLRHEIGMRGYRRVVERFNISTTVEKLLENICAPTFDS
jgi:glycosyltransferase involved in cell wall biosynthesis